jgi:uncharacterized membrane protein
MAATASKPRRATPAKRAPQKPVKRAATKAAKRTGTKAAKAAVGHPSVRRLGLAAVRAAAKRAVNGGVERLAQGGSMALHEGRELVARRLDLVSRQMAERPPIQVSVDVAVPLAVAWSEWMGFEAFTEGVRRIEDIERDRDRLIGRAEGIGGSTDWEAEIVDEREQEAFAWRSLQGTDCAGLITFHRLSERLTRIELDLDVRAAGPGDAIALSLPLARRRAEAELRRFKARVEFINPDVYESAEEAGEEAGESGNSGQEEPGRDNSKGGDT